MFDTFLYKYDESVTYGNYVFIYYVHWSTTQDVLEYLKVG